MYSKWQSYYTNETQFYNDKKVDDVVTFKARFKGYKSDLIRHLKEELEELENDN